MTCAQRRTAAFGWANYQHDPEIDNRRPERGRVNTYSSAESRALNFQLDSGISSTETQVDLNTPPCKPRWPSSWCSANLFSTYVAPAQWLSLSKIYWGAAAWVRRESSARGRGPVPPRHRAAVLQKVQSALGDLELRVSRGRKLKRTGLRDRAGELASRTTIFKTPIRTAGLVAGGFAQPGGA